MITSTHLKTHIMENSEFSKPFHINSVHIEYGLCTANFINKNESMFLGLILSITSKLTICRKVQVKIDCQRSENLQNVQWFLDGACS